MQSLDMLASKFPFLAKKDKQRVKERSEYSRLL